VFQIKFEVLLSFEHRLVYHQLGKARIGIITNHMDHVDQWHIAILITNMIVYECDLGFHPF